MLRPMDILAHLHLDTRSCGLIVAPSVGREVCWTSVDGLFVQRRKSTHGSVGRMRHTEDGRQRSVRAAGNICMKLCFSSGRNVRVAQLGGRRGPGPGYLSQTTSNRCLEDYGGDCARPAIEDVQVPEPVAGARPGVQTSRRATEGRQKGAEMQFGAVAAPCDAGLRLRLRHD